jgi:hypothetical protein
MPPPSRIATILAAGAAVAVIAVLLALGVSSGAAAEQPCGAEADHVWVDANFRVARRIRDEELVGVTVSRAMHTISSDRALAQAVADGDLAGIHQQIGVLLYNHEHVVRIRVLSATGAVLVDVGGRKVLSPRSGTLRLGGHVVGSFLFSVQDDNGYRLLVKRLVGADTVMRNARGRTVMSSIAVGHRTLPAIGVVRVRGRRYLVTTILASRFPAGLLSISLLFPHPPASLARVGCAQIRADVAGAIARRVFLEARTGPGAVIARSAVHASVILPAAVASGNLVEIRHSAQRLRAAAHIARVRVLAPDGSVIVDVGNREPLIEPNGVALRDSSGALIGRVDVSVQSVHGFIGVAGYLTRTLLLVRDGARQLGGPVAGPASLPSSGPVTYYGMRYDVSSFTAALYPSGRATVYSLSRG